MGRVAQDIRYAVRTAIRTPSVSILAILAFALGIGVTTAVFSIFSGVLLAPLPFPDPDQLVAVYGTQPACATCPARFPSITTGRPATRYSPRWGARRRPRSSSPARVPP